MEKFNALTVDRLELCFKGSIALHNTMEAQEFFNLPHFNLFPTQKSLGLVKYGVELNQAIPDVPYRYFGTITLRLEETEENNRDYKYFWLTLNNQMLYTLPSQRFIKIYIKLLANELHWTLNNITKFELAYDVAFNAQKAIETYIKNTDWDNIFLNKTFPTGTHIPYLAHDGYGTDQEITLEQYRIKGSDKKFQLYVYDKAQEITHSDKYYIEDYYGQSLPTLWRCELRCYKPQFEEFQEKYRIDVETLLEDYLFEPNGQELIMEYLSSRLLRFRKNRNNIKSVYQIVKEATIVEE